MNKIRLLRKILLEALLSFSAVLYNLILYFSLLTGFTLDEIREEGVLPVCSGLPGRNYICKHSLNRISLDVQRRENGEAWKNCKNSK